VQTIEQPLTLFDQHLNGLPAVPVAAQQHQSVRMHVCKHKLCPHGRGGRRCSTLRCRCPRPGAVNRPRMPRSTARARRRRCICCRHSPLKRLFPLRRVVSAARLVLLDVLLLLWRQDTWVKPHQGNRRWRGKLCAVPRMVHACASSPGMTSASSASEGTRRSLFPRLTACADIHLHSPTRSRGRAECILRSRRARRYIQVSPQCAKAKYSAQESIQSSHFPEPFTLAGLAAAVAEVLCGQGAFHHFPRSGSDGRDGVFTARARSEVEVTAPDGTEMPA
jgi:hypothetical protein